MPERNKYFDTFGIYRENMSFGESLKQWRKRRGLTQQELADAVNINISYVSNLERNFSATSKDGKPQPSVELVDRIARVLNVDLSEARQAAGYAPINPPGPTITLEDIGQISFQKDLAKPERERIERLIRTVLAADKMQRQDEE